jgi:DNA-binding beta-propeller fold protein YncE
VIAAASLILGLAAVGQTDAVTHVGALSEGLRGPARLAIAPDDSILVTDPELDRVLRFNSSGDVLGSWNVPAGPIGVGAHPDGRIFVSLRDQPRVAVYSEAFDLLGYLGEGNPAVSFAGPTDIDIAAGSGRIYVVDSEGDRVYGFESDGSLALALGTRGNAAGEFLYPSAVAVDERRGCILVADHDNFRVQLFTTSGVFLRQFGERLTSSGGGIEGWVVRPLGLDVDESGNVYLADAMMSTVRVFDVLGREVDKILDYGSGAGDLRTPCDVAVGDGSGRLYVASVNSSRVEMYSLNGTPDSASARYWKRQLLASKHASGDGYDAAGTQSAESNWDGSHIVEDRQDLCTPCHGITGQPGGHAGTVEGQTALCMSCHNGGGRALQKPIHERDLADPFATNPAVPDGEGRSHAWGVPAVSAVAHSDGPSPGSLMSAFLDSNGLMKCATCHNQHNLDNGPSYVRVPNDGDAMCKECHAPLDRVTGEPGSHPVGIAYPGGEDEYPVESALTGVVTKDGRVECLSCHAVHGADSGVPDVGDGMLLRTANDETGCQVCHTDHLIHDAAGVWQPTCNECHGIHDTASSNTALIARTVDGVAVTFAGDGQGCSGASDFVHGVCEPPAYDGICEVCHTQTEFHRNAAAGDHEHFTNIRCTACHPHSNGFTSRYDNCADCHGEPPDGVAFPNLAGAHAIHQTDAHGPQISDCSTCHSSEDAASHMDGVASFATGVDSNLDGTIDLSETDVCNECHSPGGPFDGVNDPVIGAKANWNDGVYDGDVLKPGKADWCLGCHDGEPALVNEVSAPLIAGDNETWGYKLGGHGTGEVLCTECHDPTLPHTDGIAQTFSVRFPLASGGSVGTPEERERDREWYNDGYRLRRIDGQHALEIPRESLIYSAGDSRLCLSCHDEVKLLGVPANYVYPTPPPPHLALPSGVAQTNYRNESRWGNAWEGAPVNIHWQHMSFGGAIWDIDQDGWTVDSAATCVTCHNPHSAEDMDGGMTAVMTARDLDISFGVYNDGENDLEYGYIGSDAFHQLGGDLHCLTCHPFSGAGRDPPITGLHTRFYRAPLDISVDTTGGDDDDTDVKSLRRPRPPGRQ